MRREFTNCSQSISLDLGGKIWYNDRWSILLSGRRRKGSENMGRFIVLDGLDASGKETQTEYLRRALSERGEQVRVLSYPRYGTVGCGGVELYLKGALGEHPEDTGAYAASTLFAVDRYLSYRTEWAGCDGTVIANRYTTANAVHQLSKLPRDRWEEFLTWLWDFEFVKLGIPAPDRIFYLELTPELSRRLLEERAEKTGREKDIHESDPDYLGRCYEAALFAANRLGWTVIRCYEGDRILSREQIHRAILSSLDAEG